MQISCNLCTNDLFLQFHVEQEVDVQMLILRREVQRLVAFQHVDGICCAADRAGVVPQDVHVVHRCPRRLTKRLVSVLVIDDLPCFLLLHFVVFLFFLLRPEKKGVVKLKSIARAETQTSGLLVEISLDVLDSSKSPDRQNPLCCLGGRQHRGTTGAQELPLASYYN